MSDRLKKEMEKITIPDELHNRAVSGVEQAKREKEEGKSPVVRFFQSKVTRFAGVAVLLLSLVIGSGFVSPTMANMLAKVPYLSTFFDAKPIENVIEAHLLEEGYEIAGVQQSPYPDKVMKVAVKGSEQYVDEVKEEIKDKTKELLLDYQYDAFDVKVVKYQPRKPTVMDEETKRYAEEAELLMKNVGDAFEEHGFTFNSFGVQHTQKERLLTMDVPDTETHVEEMKQVAKEVIDSLGFEDFKVKVRLIDMELQERERIWASKIIPVLHEGLRAKKEFHTKGMAYSFHPLPLQVIVKTTLKSTDDDAKQIAKKIEKTVEEFLASEEIAPLIEGEEYILIVRSSDQKKLN